MRVIHVAPTAFGSGGLFGGGERYPLELARALAEEVDCELITFGDAADDRREGRLRIRVLRPLGHVGGHPARPIVPSLPRAVGRTDGIPEVVEDGETGFLVAPGDLAGLRQRIETLLDDRAPASRMGAQARDRVLARWTGAQRAQRCLAAYRELVSA